MGHIGITDQTPEQNYEGRDNAANFKPHYRCFALKIKKIFSKLSILHKLLVFYILIITICITLMTTVIVSKSTKTIHRFSDTIIEQVMLSSYRSMATQIDDIQYVFTSLQANKNIQKILRDHSADDAAENVAELDHILFGTDIYEKKFNNIELYAIGHPEYADCDSGYVYPSETIENLSVYGKIIADTSAYIWETNDNNYSASSSISVMKALIDTYTLEPVAIVRIEIRTPQFVDRIQNIEISDSGRLFLCNSDGHIINPYNDSFIARFSNNESIKKLIKTNDDRSITYSDMNSENYLISVRPLSGTGMYLVGAVLTSDFVTPATALRDAAVFTALIMIIIILLLLRYISSYISKPILDLSKSMEKFSLDSPQYVTYDKEDEIAKLYNSFNEMQKRNIELRDDLEESLMILKKSELKAVQAQISPHFLYNALNSINALAKKHSVDDIEMMTAALSRFFTRTLNNGNTYTTIGNELIQVQSYIQIQNVRFLDKFKLEINVDDEIQKYGILNLTLQPIVENCIVHGFKNVSGECIIQIDAEMRGDGIYITVRDNGLGANVTDVDELNEYIKKPFKYDDTIEKYGTHNVNKRIELYYGAEYGLSYEYNEPQGLTAIIHIGKKEI